MHTQNHHTNQPALMLIEIYIFATVRSGEVSWLSKHEEGKEEGRGDFVNLLLQ